MYTLGAQYKLSFDKFKRLQSRWELGATKAALLNPRWPPTVASSVYCPQQAPALSCLLPPQVDDLKAKLAVQEAELKQKNENADKLIQVVGVETEKVSKEKAIADEEEIKVEVINKVGRRGLPAGSDGSHPQRDSC